MTLINHEREYLRTSMGEFSQKNWASGWLDDLEVRCQKLIDGDRSVQFMASDEDLDLLKKKLSWCHSRVHGWWVWLGDAPIFMNDNEVKAYHSINAVYYAGCNSGDVEYFTDYMSFVVSHSQSEKPVLEITDIHGNKHTVKEDQWVILEDDGKIIVLDAMDFLEYIKTKREVEE